MPVRAARGRFDTAGRSFAALVTASLLAGGLTFCAVAGVLVGLVAARIADDGGRAFAGEAPGVWLAVAFVAVVLAGAVMAAGSIRRQLVASRTLARRVRQLASPPTPRLADAAARAGLAGRVALLDSDEAFSFAYGLLTPRVVVSRGLLDAASPAELAAVLEHERYHVRNLDPLKVLIARMLPAALFYLPALASLGRRYVTARELAADRQAVEAYGRTPLAGALYKVLRGPSWPELRAAAALGGETLLDVRLIQLETGREPFVGRPSRRQVAASLAAAILMASLFGAAIAALGGSAAFAEATGEQLAPLTIVGPVLCAIPWAAAAWLGYRYLVRRSARPLDGRDQ
ncbi:MAG TPA: M56 family metallopeptidase [Solirubrobacteraceae bacterium]|nr:M56 family metallopeptidase [Solirubrobacteraceae bacterium]